MRLRKKDQTGFNPKERDGHLPVMKGMRLGGPSVNPRQMNRMHYVDTKLGSGGPL